MEERVPHVAAVRDLSRLRLGEILRGRRVAVVGNSGCQIGRGSGPRIDAHDVVCRFNNFSTAPVYRSDYGERTDVWVYNGSREIVPRAADGLKVVCPLPLYNERYRRRYRITSDALLRRYPRTEFVPLEVYEAVLVEIRDPSTGVLFLYWAHWLTGRLPSLFGFGWFAPQHRHHYFDGFDFCNHDGELERRFIARLAQA